MDGLPPSVTPRGRKDVYSSRSRLHQLLPGRNYTAGTNETDPLKTCINLALLNAMVVKVKEAHGAQGLVDCQSDPSTIASRVTKEGIEINRRYIWMHLNRSHSNSSRIVMVLIRTCLQ